MRSFLRPFQEFPNSTFQLAFLRGLMVERNFIRDSDIESNQALRRLESEAT